MTAYHPILPFISRLKIVDKDVQTRVLGRVINPAQMKLVTAVEEDIRVGRPIRHIVLKARQVGFSTAIEAMAYQWSFCQPRNRGLVISHRSDSVEHLLSMTEHYWSTWWAQSLYRATSQARDKMAWEPTGSKLSVLTAKSAEAARSRTFQFVHASEAAFWEDAGTLMRGLQVPKRALTAIFIESTANGIGNWYHEMWEAAKNGDVAYTPHFFPWWQHPEYNSEWIGRGDDARKLSLARLGSGGHLDDEEWQLYRMLSIRGMDDAEIRSRLMWRRFQIADDFAGDLDGFHQEYPACVVGETRVGTSRGIVEIRDVVDSDTTRHGRVILTQAQPPSPIYALSTAEGYQLEATADHPIITPDGPVELCDLAPGDTVTLSSPATSTFPASVCWHDCGIDHTIALTDDLALFLGIFAGDGSHHGGTTSIACDAKDQDVIDECVRLFDVVFGVEARVRTVGEKGGGREVRTGVVKIRDTLDHLGVIGRRPSTHGTNRDYHRKVCVPEVIWRSPPHHIRAFLRGLFEADGFAGAAGTAPRVSLFSKHPEFLRDVQILLLSQGIVSRITGGALEMRGERAVVFRDTIGWVGKRKNSRAASWTEPRAGGRRRVINTFTATVAAITPTGRVEPTYNLTLADGTDHAFDAGGILTHNTDDEAFLSTGRNVFHLSYLRAAYDPVIPDVGKLVYDSTALPSKVRFIPDPSGPLSVYEYPAHANPSQWYLIGIDNSKATQFGDYSVGQVIKRDSLEQVATWRQRGMNEVMFAEQMMLLGRWYNTAMLAPEYNMNGAGINAIVEQQYPSYYVHRKAGKLRGVHDGIVGWPMTEQTKNECVSMLHREVFAAYERRSNFAIHDEPTYFEMKNYIINDKGKYENSKNAAHDDTVTSLAIAVAAASYERPSMAKQQVRVGRASVPAAVAAGIMAVGESQGAPVGLAATRDHGVDVGGVEDEGDGVSSRSREHGRDGDRPRHSLVLPPELNPFAERDVDMYSDGEY